MDDIDYCIVYSFTGALTVISLSDTMKLMQVRRSIEIWFVWTAPGVMDCYGRSVVD